MLTLLCAIALSVEDFTPDLIDSASTIAPNVKRIEGRPPPAWASGCCGKDDKP